MTEIRNIALLENCPEQKKKKLIKQTKTLTRLSLIIIVLTGDLSMRIELWGAKQSQTFVSLFAFVKHLQIKFYNFRVVFVSAALS